MARVPSALRSTWGQSVVRHGGPYAFAHPVHDDGQRPQWAA